MHNINFLSTDCVSFSADLIRLIQPDLDNFDPRVWIIAVSIVLGTLVILAVGLCIVLSKECYESSQMGTDTTTSPNDCKLDVVIAWVIFCFGLLFAVENELIKCNF